MTAPPSPPPPPPDRSFSHLVSVKPPPPIPGDGTEEEQNELPPTPPPSPSQSSAGTLIRYLWTCHKCGSGTFIRKTEPMAECLYCSHPVCTGCTSSFGERLLHCVDADAMAARVANPGCTCERSSKINRCRTSHAIRRCPSSRRARAAARYAPYAVPTLVQHCIVTFRPGRDGLPELGTFFFTRPRYETTARTAARLARQRSSHGDDDGDADETLDCIANSVAAARRRIPSSVIPPIYDMLRPPCGHEAATAAQGIKVSSEALARFFASGAASMARSLGITKPVVCVHVDPMLAFVAYYLCTSFLVVYMAWREGRGRLLRALD